MNSYLGQEIVRITAAQRQQILDSMNDVNTLIIELEGQQYASAPELAAAALKILNDNEPIVEVLNGRLLDSPPWGVTRVQIDAWDAWARAASTLTDIVTAENSAPEEKIQEMILEKEEASGAPTWLWIAGGIGAVVITWNVISEMKG